jgi:hypothetical protein
MIYIHLVSHMQSLLYAESISGIKQPTWFTKPVVELVQLATHCDLLLVMIVKLMFVKLVILMFVSVCDIYVCETC